MILGLEADAGSGKSALGYTGPLPLVAFAFDAGANRAIYSNRFSLYKDIDIKLIKYPPTMHMMDLKATQEFWKRNEGRAITIYMMTPPLQAGTKVTGMAELWNSFIALYNRAKDDMGIATVMVDTMTVARRVANSAHLQNVQRTNSDRVNLIQIEYGRPNEQVRSAYQEMQNTVEMSLNNDILDQQKHLIVTHHLDNVYVKKINAKGDVESVELTDIQGNPLRQLEGLKDTLRYVDVQLRMVPKTFPGFPDVTKRVTGIQATFIKCGYDLTRTGTTIDNPTWDSLARMLNEHLEGPMKIGLRGDVLPDNIYDIPVGTEAPDAAKQ